MIKDLPKLQTIIINKSNGEKAVIHVWEIGNDIVLGGIGWYEYFDYEKMKKEEKESKKETET